ncbi:hypothetical protein [Ralstonia phage RP31]|uniref:Uncharacterized protein n=1 Tax=Ralstonia phage RP31 TaxID=1923890 RepID=A0A1L7N1C0_9CAUD|nr:hypothetical protein [Ralstonia phage RP31]
MTFKEVCQTLRDKGFYLIVHFIVLHHLRKEFGDYDVISDRFYILPVGNDFLHIAVIECDTGRGEPEIQVRYTCAGDDLLYGLRVKFNSGGSPDPKTDLDVIDSLIANGNLREQPRYIRKRFRHGRFQAKFRALLVYLKDQWRVFFPKG